MAFKKPLSSNVLIQNNNDDKKIAKAKVYLDLECIYIGCIFRPNPVIIRNYRDDLDIGPSELIFLATLAIPTELKEN